jgi:murein DD-endopeptidase MepM/ murein hydrolase activator NlpD
VANEKTTGLEAVRAAQSRIPFLWLLLAVLSVVGLLHVAARAAQAQTAYAGVWQPGSGAQWWRAGMSTQEFKDQDKAYFDKGLRLTDVEIVDGKYLAVWRPGSGAQWWRAGMSTQEFKDQDKAYFDQGLRLTDVEIVDGKYLAVWRPGSGAQWWRAGMSLQEFKDQDKAYFDKGLRLTDVEIAGGKYLAVWRPGSGAQWWRAGMTYQEFKAQDKTYFNQGLRLTTVGTAGGKYLAVWRPGSGAQWWWSGLCRDDFKTEDKTYFDHGLRLVNVELHSNPKAIYRLPFDDDSDWKLTNGNWDDPSGGGHGGKVDGLQAFAFDFVHDSNDDGTGEGGQNVRAARGGVVHVVVESESKNSWGSKDFCKDGVGNYLVIKHNDGTFGTYWHLSKNGVHVNVGDTVERGDIIATSGNTGNSTTPHIHFDVRTGWDLNYSKCNLSGTELPSVKILFEDESHACWIPREGDALASNND